MTIPEVCENAKRLIDNVERVILGKRSVIEEATVALLCGGHVLFDDVPGVGKTMLAKAFAASLGSSFKRIQFTPDLLPSDVVGVSIFDQKTGEFRFSAGPIFANVVLADEINRAGPKTQSSLLECMEEGQVTVDGISHVLPCPFFVMATENPIEYEGTYPLPESQLDRFLMKLHLGYPDRESERAVVEAQRLQHPIHSISAVLGGGEVDQMQEAIKQVRVERAAEDYVLDIVAATRSHQQVYLGASPRGSLSLSRAAQALAAVNGLDYVLPDHIKRLAPPVLAHRLIVRPEARIAGTAPEDVVREIVASVAVD